MPQPTRPPGNGNGTPDPKIAELEKELAIRDTQIASFTDNVKELTTQRDRLAKRVEELQSTLTAQEGQLGELRAKAAEADKLRAERDDLAAQLSQERAQADARTADAVKQALAAADEQHKAQIEKLNQEKADLQSQLDTLQAQLAGEGVTGRVAPSILAGQFAAVLEQHAAPAPKAGRPFAAALTGLEVQARGMLEAPKEGETEPLLRTVEAGAIDPGQLSTVTMRFSLLPQGVPVPQEPEPDA